MLWLAQLLILLVLMGGVTALIFYDIAGTGSAQKYTHEKFESAHNVSTKCTANGGRPVGFRWPHRVDSDAAKYPQRPMPEDKKSAGPSAAPAIDGPCAVVDPTDAAPVGAVDAPLLPQPERPYCKRSASSSHPQDPHAIIVRWRQIEDLWLACSSLKNNTGTVDTSCPKICI